MNAHPAVELWLRRLVLRNELGPGELQAIRDLPIEPTRVAANRDFVRLGETTNRSCLVADGLVGRFSQAADGARQITALHIAGDMADLHSAALPTAASALQALTDTIILRVPHDAIHRTAQEFPRLAQAFWRDCVVDAANLSEWALNLGRRPALARIAHLLIEMAIRYFMIGRLHGNSYRFPATQIQLGDVSGLTSVHVNRMLRALRDAGVASIQSQSVRINDWSGLCAAASYDPQYMQVPQSVLDGVNDEMSQYSIRQ